MKLFSFQAVCGEMSRLAPTVGLHHDGVVFGSDDFCASIGGFHGISSLWTGLSFLFFQRMEMFNQKHLGTQTHQQ